MWFVCHSATFDMIRLMMTNGMQFSADMDPGIIHALLGNSTMGSDDKFQYNLDGKIYADMHCSKLYGH